MNFPINPALNQQYTFSGKTWKWNGDGWEIVIADPLVGYAGSTSITTLGTITTGTWQGGIVDVPFGGTGLGSYTPGSFLYASGTATLGQRTPAQVLVDIGGLAAATYTASDVLAKLLTVDGIGSLLDADLLDAQNGAYYLNWNNFTSVPATFTPSTHVHTAADITSGVISTARLGTGTPSSTTVLRGDGVWTPDTAAYSWVTVDAADVTAVTNTGYVMLPGIYTRNVQLPASAPVGFNIQVHPRGGMVRIVSNGNILGKLPSGDNLLVSDHQGVSLVARSTGVFDIVKTVRLIPPVPFITTLFGGGAGLSYFPDVPTALVERRNLLLWSEDFTNAYWGKNAGGVVANATTAPDGTLTADKHIETAVTNQHWVYKDALATCLNGAPVTFTCYMKQGERRYAQMRILTSGNTVGNAGFDLQTGTTYGAITGTARVTPAADGWYLCEVTAIAIGTALSVYTNVNNAALLTTNYLGDGASGIYIWGAQLELGSTPTAYQKVTDWTTEYLAVAGSNITSFQTYNGITPVTAVEQPNGLMLDNRMGLVRGPNLVVNSDFGDGANGWYVATNSSVINGELHVVALNTMGLGDGSTAIRPSTALSIPNGAICLVEFDAKLVSGVDSLGAGQLYVQNKTITAAENGGIMKRYSFIVSKSQPLPAFAMQATAGEWIVDNVSVRVISGNHSAQATTAARPVLSARVNLLTKSEQFDDAAWVKNATTVVANAVLAPDGTLTGDRLLATAGSANHDINMSLSASLATVAGNVVTYSAYFKAAEYAFARVVVQDAGADFVHIFDLVGGVVSLTQAGSVCSISNAVDGWKRCVIVRTYNGANGILRLLGVPTGATGGIWTASGTDGISIWGAQAERSPTATRYQRINTASDYNTLDFPHYDYFDGVDDEVYTGTVALNNNMDYFVAMYRTTAGNLMLGKNASGGNASSFFGTVELNGGNPANSGTGTTATLYVNGVAVPGGTATSRAQLHTAVPVGQWCIFEARNLDLSLWTTFSFGNYTGFNSPVRIGGQVLVSAQTDTKRTEIRRYLAAKVGVTLP